MTGSGILGSRCASRALFSLQFNRFSIQISQWRENENLAWHYRESQRSKFDSEAQSPSRLHRSQMPKPCRMFLSGIRRGDGQSYIWDNATKTHRKQKTIAWSSMDLLFGPESPCRWWRSYHECCEQPTVWAGLREPSSEDQKSIYIHTFLRLKGPFF